MGFLSKAAGSLGGIAGGAIGSVFGPAGAMIGYGIGSSLGNAYASDNAYKQQLNAQYGLIDYQNTYNDPKNVMARLENAGLNPNLVYGSGATNLASAGGNAPKYQMPERVALENLYNIQKQNDLLQTQIDNTYWQAGINQNSAVEANANARIAQYNADYAEKEHEIFKKTGKIPETFKRTDWSGELAGWLKGLISSGI